MWTNVRTRGDQSADQVPPAPTQLAVSAAPAASIITGTVCLALEVRCLLLKSIDIIYDIKQVS